MKKTYLSSCILLSGLFLFSGCSKRYIGPTILTGIGAGSIVGGVAYRVSLGDSDRIFGDTSKEQAVTTTLIFAGTALMLAGVIWSATTPVCKTDADCWGFNVCNKKTDMCVSKGVELSGEDSVNK